MQTRTFSAIGTYFLLIPGFNGAVGSYVLRAIRANSSVAADRWIQVFAGTAVPANGTVPLFAPLLLPNIYITAEDYLEGRIVPTDGIVIAVSSTRDTLTVDAAAVCDITVEIDEFELPIAGSTVVGDITTAVKSRIIWAEAAGPKTLLKVETNRGAGAALFIQLFPEDGPAEGAVPLMSWPFASGESKVLHFGNNAGLVPYRQSAAAVKRQGCTLVFSTTQNTKTIVLADIGPIRATYR